MKQLLITLSFALLIAGAAHAQESEEQIISLNSNGTNAISSNNGNLTITLNGARFEIGNGKVEHKTTETKRPQRAFFGFMGLESPYFNHIALFEIGTNMLVDTDYSMYTPEDANALMFSSTKSISYTLNVGTLNVPLNPSNTLVFSMAYGFTIEDFAFNSNYTFKHNNGIISPVELDSGTKLSKFNTTYFHIPMMFDWNIKHDFFISAGMNLDILMGTQINYKFPKTTIIEKIPVSPIQVGATARIGWKRLYGYVNYSFVNLFREGTGPKGKRLSAGAGFWF